MEVISHSTLQLPLPAQVVARTSQNLHSRLTFIMLAPVKTEEREESTKGSKKVQCTW